MGGLSLYSGPVRVYVFLGLVALEFSALALLISSLSNSVDAAVRKPTACCCAQRVDARSAYFFQGTEGMTADVGEWLRNLSPIAALMSLTGAGDAGGQGLTTKDDLSAGS